MDGLGLYAGLALAAFAAGSLNAIAGGGSFLTFPALVFAGVPPIMANATSALAVSPGYLGSTLGFRAELAQLPRQRLWREAALAATGGALGAGLLLLTSERLFATLVPWLLLLATALFAIGPQLAPRLSNPAGAAPSNTWGPSIGLLLVAIYGGYFNGGLGILLMALYSLSGESRLHTINALKNMNSLVLSLVSVLAFALAAHIAWDYALVMMCAATLGGYAGAKVAQRLPLAVLRWGVIATGLVMSALFFARG